MEAKNAPWFPVEYDQATVRAVKDVAAGTATPDQQQRAMKWIIEHACGTYELSYRPTSDRDTSFAEGRRFVGLQIVKAVNLDMTVFERKE